MENKACEIGISEDSETITNEESSSFPGEATTNTKEIKKTCSKRKRRCVFNQRWLADTKYGSFIRECQTNKYFAHCSICKSVFSISNGGTYLINRHIEQPSHKRLAEIQAKEKCKV